MSVLLQLLTSGNLVYSSDMRRLTAVLILGMIGLFTGVPLLAFSRSAQEAALPACCRSHGKHHCIMTDASLKSASSGTFQVAATPRNCPFYPKGIAAAGITLHAATRSCAVSFSRSIRVLSIHPQTMAFYRLSLDRARQKRGPPDYTSLEFALQPR
jgi:hypothetical protein